MLTEEIIARVQRLDSQLGVRRGACFGVLDSSRLRQNSSLTYVFRGHDYVLFFSGPDGKEREVHFPVSSREAAIARTKQQLGIEDRLTTRTFRLAGGKKLMLGSKQIYPPQQADHRGGGK